MKDHCEGPDTCPLSYLQVTDRGYPPHCRSTEIIEPAEIDQTVTRYLVYFKELVVELLSALKQADSSPKRRPTLWLV